jgi:hypothetical protein
VKNKLESYFGDKKEYARDKRELEAYHGDLIKQRIENNLSKLVVSVESQLRKPMNEAQTQTQAEVIEGKQFFTNLVHFKNPELVRLS